jgi:hypothetical protein
MNEDMEISRTDSKTQSAGCEVVESEAKKQATNGWLESIYENFSGVPVRYLDIFIAVCVIAFAADILVGVLKAKGML